MEDNPSDKLTKAQKLPLIREYRAAWDNVHTEETARQGKSIPMKFDGLAWELGGGVLAESIWAKGVQFRQLPSRIRGISEHTWTTSFSLNMDDFTIDPGQDLLAALERVSSNQSVLPSFCCCPPSHEECLLDILSTYVLCRRESDIHWQANLLPVNVSAIHIRTAFEIRINGDLLGILARQESYHINQTWSCINVWNWRTGEHLLSSTEQPLSFLFMGDRYLLTLKPPDILEGPAIVVHDIFVPSRRWMFQLPLVQGTVGGGSPGEGGGRILIREMNFISETGLYPNLDVVSEPGATWRPSTMLSPFYVARREKLIVLVMNLIFNRRQPMVSLTVSTLSSRLLACIEAVEPPIEGVDRRIMWQDWGDKNCRMGYWPNRWDGGWPCVSTYGTKYACLEKNRVTLYDFNQPAVRHGASRNGDHEGSNSTEYVMHSTDLETGFFDKPVVTSLPYRKRTPENPHIALIP
ncbi:hypothetical protein PHLCEN_2v946 [Hermanssonia centrifuga]|uniref:Uncharacterized protein n=1 Tax=Hermanssonia centrifuga TaxID=98765 RepID=A0A2R6S4J2_9APHY|nr:hypothetical protein PHLCEN_2v946 [Hermanssonia centrifuga]